MVFTTRAVCRNSPRSGRPSTSSDMVCDRSPLATAPITRATSVDGCTRSPIRLLTDSTHSAQAPADRSNGRALGDLAVLAHRPADAVELADHFLVELQNVVQGVGDLALQAGLVHRHADREVPLLEGDQRLQQHVARRGGPWPARPRQAQRDSTSSGLAVNLRSLEPSKSHSAWNRAPWRRSQRSHSSFSWLPNNVSFLTIKLWLWQSFRRTHPCQIALQQFFVRHHFERCSMLRNFICAIRLLKTVFEILLAEDNPGRCSCCSAKR